jgi:hypothetical protein
MSITPLPVFYDMYYVEFDKLNDENNGRLTADAYLFNDQTFQVLNYVVVLLNLLVNSAIINNTIVNNGIQFPQFTTAQISALVPNSVIGTVWFNVTLGKLQVLTAPGLVETITST